MTSILLCDSLRDISLHSKLHRGVVACVISFSIFLTKAFESRLQGEITFFYLVLDVDDHSSLT